MLLHSNTLIDGHVKAGNMTEAFSFKQKMVEERISPDAVTYTTLINGLCLQGDVGTSMNLLDQMI